MAIAAPVLGLELNPIIQSNPKQLFRCESLGKEVSIRQLGAKIIEFVNATEPHKKMSVHMLRKIAASLNYFQFMKFEDIKKYTGWKSIRTFY